MANHNETPVKNGMNKSPGSGGEIKEEREGKRAIAEVKAGQELVFDVLPLVVHLL